MFEVLIYVCRNCIDEFCYYDDLFWKTFYGIRDQSISLEIEVYFLYAAIVNLRHTVFFVINAPSLLIAPPPPLFSTFAKFIFRGFTSLSTADTFAIPGFRKMVHFSTSQANIAYEK